MAPSVRSFTVADGQACPAEPLASKFSGFLMQRHQLALAEAKQADYLQ